MAVQERSQPSAELKSLEKEAAELRKEKAALQLQLGDCQGRLETAQRQLQNALVTQEAAQTHLDQLQKVSMPVSPE